MTGYLIGMWVLIIGVVALHQRQAQRAKTVGLIALIATTIGTVNMAGNIWFDTFVAPWLAREIPAALEVPRNGTLVAGALFSYVSMAAGWMLFGLACIRARFIPLSLAICLIPAGFLAFFPLPPYSIGFGAIVLAIGIWLTRYHQKPSTQGVLE